MAFILQSEAHLPKMNGLHINGQDSLVQPLLMDLYQLNMCYGYWRAGTFDDDACFDLFFRKNPFKGEFTVFVGLEDCLRLVQNFHFSASDMDFIREVLPNAEPEFYEFLENLTCRKLKIFAIPEGTVVFPNMPLITLEGPLALCQLLETVLLNLVNYSSLVATNAARFRQVSGERVELLEFGLRRAQGPNGGLSASKYCYVGGFDSTSNLLAGKLFGIPVKGTQAHSFISSFSAESDLHARTLTAKDGARSVDLVELSQRKLRTLMDQIEWGNLTGRVIPTGFLALIDTYDVLRSGVINFCAVTLAMHDLGYRAVGCRIDSGDLSKFDLVSKKIAALDYRNLSWIENLTIVASNDINEETIVSLNDQQHEINAFGVGTHLVTCQKQPALGCVYKLVTKSGLPKIKISQDVVKITIPGRKRCYRLYGKAGFAILDLMTLDDEPAPAVNTEILCRHPFEESKRAKVIPAKVEQLQLEFWDGEDIRQTLPSLREMRNRVHQSIGDLRSDHKRIVNPTPYKVSVSERLYHFLHTIWLQNAPIGQLE
ncbi:Nicotinate phosphoribosyltransferase domain containing protein [Aphelenchoides besseyi]|nr:Nicotinate phosphoribosyltransferase domain containing protein [Aphelenchoides besseyi]